MSAPHRGDRLSYAIVTPVRNEAGNLQRLFGVLQAQRLAPTRWVIIDTGSTDETMAVAHELADASDWVAVDELPSAAGVVRGGPIVKAFHRGLASVPGPCEVVVKLDADISMEPDYFDRLVAEFAADDRLGIAGGACYERGSDGVWRQRHGTGPGVWGASRAYRRACLADILPLEEHMGWDTIDLIAAGLKGWSTRGFLDLPFFHLRSEGERDGSRFAHWAKNGQAAHYMGYRFSYLTVRTLFRSLGDPWAIGIVWGYLEAAFEREPRCQNADVRRYVREQQRLSHLPRRAREAMRPRAAIDGAPERAG